MHQAFRHATAIVYCDCHGCVIELCLHLQHSLLLVILQTSFRTQANALMRKNLCFQRRNLRTTIFTILVPVLFCALLAIIQAIVDSALDSFDNKVCFLVFLQLLLAGAAHAWLGWALHDPIHTSL